MATTDEVVSTDTGKKPLFRDLDADLDLDELEASEIESVCMRCYKNVSEIRMQMPFFSL